VRRPLSIALVLLVALVAASSVYSARTRPAPRPKTGAAPWPAPKDPMALARKAGLVPEHFEHLTYHVHSHLDIFLNGKKLPIPAGIGINIHDPKVMHGPIDDGSIAYGGITDCKHVCISPLHTHADLGLLHTETTTPKPNTLGEFFIEWNVRLTPRCVGGYCKPDSIAFFVNGKPFSGDPRKILLINHTEIAIVIGTPPKKIPSKFPNVPL
jgi:hypothetical protein